MYKKNLLIWVAGSESGSRRAKMTDKNRKKYRIFMFWSAGCSLWRAEGVFCSLGVLYGGLGKSKLQFLIKKIKNKISSCKFFPILGHQTWIRDPDPQLEKCWIRIRIKSMRIRNPGIRTGNKDPEPDPLPGSHEGGEMNCLFIWILILSLFRTYCTKYIL